MVQPPPVALVIDVTDGVPDVVTVNEPADPWVKVVVLELLIVGLTPTV
jgi:hypothetical protein